MSAKNRFRNMKRKAKTLLTAGALAISSVYGCESGGTTQPTQKPVANFVANPQEGYAPLEVCFNGSSSKANGSPITKYIWQFGSGVADSTSGVNVCHMYQNPGNYNAGLVVEDSDGERSPQTLEQIVARDGNPVINIQNLNGIEDKVSSLDLTGKVTSPIHPLANLTITTTSPELNVTPNGSNISYTNKTKDFNGGTYIDVIVKDPEGRQVNSRIPVIVAPQTDVRGYTEQVLTGQRLPGIPFKYGTNAIQVNANGDFEFQASSNDGLKTNFQNMTPSDSANFQDVLGIRFFNGKYYNLSLPITANGQDVNLGNVQLIQRCKDTITGEDCLDFMKNYMREDRWADEDLPIKVFIDNNPPSAEYRETVRQGIMERWQPIVNQWLPQGRQIVLAEIVPSDPAIGVRIHYTAIGIPPWYSGTFRNGVIGLNPNTVGDARARITSHEFGHSLFGINPTPFDHSPYSNHVMCVACPSLPSPFEGLITAVKYKLRNGDVKYHRN